jgi:hypothetical protein
MSARGTTPAFGVKCASILMDQDNLARRCGALGALALVIAFKTSVTGQGDA